jgi:hypothetical protein
MKQTKPQVNFDQTKHQCSMSHNVAFMPYRSLVFFVQYITLFEVILGENTSERATDRACDSIIGDTQHGQPIRIQDPEDRSISPEEIFFKVVVEGRGGLESPNLENRI